MDRPVMLTREYITANSIHYQSMIDAWQERLDTLQDNCTHFFVDIKHDEDRTNYTCPDCRKEWSVLDGEENG